MAFEHGFLLAFLIALGSAETMVGPAGTPAALATTLKALSLCADQGGLTGMLNCAALRTLRTLRYLASQPSLEILPGVTLQRNANADVDAEVTEEQLPGDPQARADRLYELLVDDGAKIISGRTLRLQLPEDVAGNVARALDEGRRNKKKGGMLPFMLRMGAKLMGLVPAALAGLGLMAAKALIVAKIALLLSVFVFVSSFGKQNNGGLLGGLGLGGFGHAGTGYGYGSYNPPTWTSNSIGGNPQLPYGRSIDIAAPE